MQIKEQTRAARLLELLLLGFRCLVHQSGISVLCYLQISCSIGDTHWYMYKYGIIRPILRLLIGNLYRTCRSLIRAVYLLLRILQCMVNTVEAHWPCHVNARWECACSAQNHRTVIDCLCIMFWSQHSKRTIIIIFFLSIFSAVIFNDNNKISQIDWISQITLGAYY